MSDNVNHPEHYNSGGMECIDAMEAAFGSEAVKEFCHLNAFKYLWRCGQKDKPQQELAKARWYINKEIEILKTLENEKVISED